MKPTAIHQFSISCRYGDGITNGMLFTRKLLRAGGLESEIFCADIDREFVGDALPHELYRGGSGHVLLIHHGIGNALEGWLRSLPGRKIMVFHNITPTEFFPGDHPIQPMLAHGWQQVAAWKEWLDGTIADSDTNLAILAEHGYDNARCRTIPLLVDLDKFHGSPSTPSPRPVEDVFHLLFVGRLVPHKNQLGLIQMLAHLRRMTSLDVHLTLVGSGDNGYGAQLLQYANELDLAACVHLAGKVADVELAEIFCRSDLYVSLSRHEGFGMPLIEAMAHRLPIVALDSPHSNVAITLGRAGIILGDGEPEIVAGVVASVMHQPLLRRQLVKSGLAELERYAPANIYRELSQFLQTLDIEIPTARFEAPIQHISDYRIEGPFDSSYSLAIVNRNLALALARSGRSLSLHATEGYGDYPVDEHFLAATPGLLDLYKNSASFNGSSTILRLMYPTRMTGMNGLNHGLSCYGWEESTMPVSTVEQINCHAHFVTSMSSYVTRTLIDNGVNTPIVTTGIGADHILAYQPDISALPALGSGFRMLHISSCFPRKGIDCLLEAFGEAFSKADDVTLVIKTFPNPHHDIAGMIGQWRKRFPAAPKLVVINRDLTEGGVRALYQQCHLLVAPSRGEGFGLPMAEAMLHRLPVVTTGYGGQNDFCTEETAWLINYRFACATTHMALSDSVWVEPDRAHLQELLLKLYHAFGSPAWHELVAGKTDAAFALVSSLYTWRKVGERLESLMGCLDRLPAVRPIRRLGCISTWNSKCGIATYSALLLKPALADCLIFANTNAELTCADDANVTRCWQAGHADNLKKLGKTVLAARVEQILIQFNFAFFKLDGFKDLLTLFANNAIGVFITFHSTADVVNGKNYKSLRSLLPELHSVERIFVHSVSDLENLRHFGLSNNTTLFPHGVKASAANFARTGELARFKGMTIISSYGFLLPHKGIQNLIRAFGSIAADYPKAQLLLVNAEYPVDVSAKEAEYCRSLIRDLALTERVTLITDFLDDAESLAWLGLSSCIVFPYERTQESSSAAVRWGLSTTRPVYCTPLPIFNDVRDVVTFFPGTGVADLAAGLASILSSSGEPRRDLYQRQQKWLADHDWKQLSHRLKNLLDSQTLNKQLSALE